MPSPHDTQALRRLFIDELHRLILLSRRAECQSILYQVEQQLMKPDTQKLYNWLRERIDGHTRELRGTLDEMERR